MTTVQMSASIVQEARSSALCSRCQSFKLGPTYAGSYYDQAVEIADITLADLLASYKSCVLCDLLLQCIRIHGRQPSLLTDSDVFLLKRRIVHTLDDWTATPTSLEESTASSNSHRYTATLKLSRKSAVTSDDDYSHYDDIHVLPVTSHCSPDASRGKAAAFIRSSLHQCEKEHFCQSRLDNERKRDFLDLVESTAFGVIDVIEMKLTTLPITSGQPEKFVALSYVWGVQKHSTVGHYRTTCMNVLDRVRPGGLNDIMDQFPPTIKDAIRLVQELDLRYLWIDAICIVQDSHDCWLINAEAMHFVYANACLTICACDGDSTSGLKGYSSSVTQVALATGYSGTDDTRVREIRDGILYTEWTSDLSLLALRPMLSLIGLSTWNTRAWTFQEHLCSAREATFVGGRVFFRCHLRSMSQNIYGNDAKFNPLICSTRTDPKDMAKSLGPPMQCYISQVEVYTAKTLTLQKDILTAFRGAQWLLQRRFETAFIFGMPVSHFDLALLWHPTGVATPRITQTSYPHSAAAGTYDTASSCGCDETSSDDVTRFPSWSWAGWLCKGVRYDRNLLGGCLKNVHWWLKNHTWIQWYIRDSNGVLRPLWRFISQQEITSAKSSPIPYAFDGPWAGYEVVDTKISRSESSQGRELEKERKNFDGSISPYNCIHNAEAKRPDVYSGRQGDHNPSSGYSEIPPHHPEHIHKIPTLRWDKYGRKLPVEVPQERKEFECRIPDHPFGVRRDYGPYDSSTLNPMPILQFFTWYGRFLVSRAPVRKETRDTGKTKLGRYNILDSAQRWCGTIMLDPDMVGKLPASSTRHFIALSDAESFAEQELCYSGVDSQTLNVPKWGIYFVMMLTRNEKRGLWERVGLGKVLKSAFEDSVWKEIELG